MRTLPALLILAAVPHGACGATSDCNLNGNGAADRALPAGPDVNVDSQVDTTGCGNVGQLIDLRAELWVGGQVDCDLVLDNADLSVSGSCGSYTPGIVRPATVAILADEPGGSNTVDIMYWMVEIDMTDVAVGCGAPAPIDLDIRQLGVDEVTLLQTPQDWTTFVTDSTPDDLGFAMIDAITAFSGNSPLDADGDGCGNFAEACAGTLFSNDVCTP